MMPSKVQHERDGKWWPWNQGHIDGDILRLKQQGANGNPITMNGVTVYALEFLNGQKWNVKEGWA